jgi:antitoxin (DNA-binding transcriptional repressor) of toxin-antitoxin stability system
MQKVALVEAETHLSELINKVALGEDVIIIGDDGASFKLVQLETKKPYPKFGSAKGLIQMSDDFDEPLTDFEEYMP